MYEIAFFYDLSIFKQKYPEIITQHFFMKSNIILIVDTLYKSWNQIESWIFDGFHLLNQPEFT